MNSKGETITVKILAVGAHPDDVEFLCAGTLARLAALSHEISILTISAGELGSVSLNIDESRELRLREARQAAAVLNAGFYYAGVKDKHIFFNDETRKAVCEIFRKAVPDIVFALSPRDYNLDHDATSLLARDAATAASARLFSTGNPTPAPPTAKIPYLYYCEPIGQIDIFGTPVRSSTYVDVTEFIETKSRMLACHATQREWMQHRFGFDNYIETMTNWGLRAGAIAGFRFAEGFRQHVAPPFPHENVLANMLQARLM